jgi:glucosamine-6-phosphate deaminase
VLPTYYEKLGELKSQGAKLTVIFGIGRVCHIAFWEPQFAGEYESEKSGRPRRTASGRSCIR